MLSGSADTGTFRIKVFYDSNNNGGCSIYEKGVGGIPVYLISAGGETVTGGKTDEEGEITLPGLDPGAYRIRASLLEENGASTGNRRIPGWTQSIMDFSSEGGEQDSDPIRFRRGKRWSGASAC